MRKGTIDRTKRFGILNVTETEDAEACYIDPTTGDKSCG